MEDRFLPPKIKVIIKEESEDKKIFKQAFAKNPIQEYMNIVCKKDDIIRSINLIVPMLSGDETLELHRLLRKLTHQAKIREEEEKNVKAVAESVASNNNAPASTLGDNNDILAGLKAKMEKNEKKK